MKIFMKQREMTRLQAIMFGLKNRARSTGWIRSVTKTMSIIAMDISRSVLFTVLRITILYPARVIMKLIRLISGTKSTSIQGE
jgi:hypothetical protein